MKKLFATMFLLTAFAVSTFAQFEKGKIYSSASLDGVGISYDKTHDFSFGLSGQFGYFVADNWLAVAEAGVNYTCSDWQSLSLGAKARYYLESNGVFCGIGFRLLHEFKNFNDFQICPEVGYCFFLNKTVTLEPSIYFDASLSDFSDKSRVGLRVGIGLYF
ncbi:MAG: outer membrane beta-barrel protein [Bacteroidaceae bacterium]|jgi:hypothetical protein|nr:outer membrane beta-barrel protein [Bacteroidaceae bacterium]MBQ2339274.1 outer membrane beta-barrel protein [Bacteroidaceae bacterium]MBQ3627711.1 outer membrane beta-barrel protein [Bacteroidaceae bacterium]MBQ5461536.1 outer membrane beta-barrel protein [Bacteroidaceae bacterium]